MFRRVSLTSRARRTLLPVTTTLGFGAWVPSVIAAAARHTGTTAEPFDIDAVSSAATIARTLRNYRQATQQQQQATAAHTAAGDRGGWLDLENLMASKHLSRLDLDAAADDSGSSGVDSNDATASAPGGGGGGGGGGSARSQHLQQQQAASRTPALRPLLTAEEIVAGSGVFRAAGLELRPELLVRLVRPRRAAHVLVDADGLAPSDVAALLGRLQLIPEASTVVVARQPAVNTSFKHALTGSRRTGGVGGGGGASGGAAHAAPRQAIIQDDVIAEGGVPTYMTVEMLAAKLHASSAVVLSDVVFVCDDRRFGAYCASVAHATPFLDADVFVYSPLRSEQVYSKFPRPSLSETLSSARATATAGVQ